MNYHYHHFFLFWRSFSTFSNFFLTIMIKKRQRTEIARERIVGYFIEIIIVEIKRRHLKGHLIIKLASGEQHANSKWHEEEKWNWKMIVDRIGSIRCDAVTRNFCFVRDLLSPLPLRNQNAVAHQIFYKINQIALIFK